MRRGVIGSATLHVAVIGATMIVWPTVLNEPAETPSVVPVELITVGEETNIAPTVREQQPAPEDEPELIAPEEIQQAAIPPEELAELEPPQFTPEAPEPAPAKTPPAPQPRMKPKPEKQKFDVDSILALLDKRAPKTAPPANARLAERTQRGIGERNAMTMDLQDALRNQIAPCWSPPLGAPSGDEMVVDFLLVLNPDGSVARPPQLDASSAAAAASNPYTRAAAEAARRAIYKCAPYRLPADRYEHWREINPFHFDPRQMMGQE
ncbi:MAG: cell envelope integrity protein TolA [Alphaproteobacteria bacterium]